MATPVSIIVSALTNFQPSQSVLAGGGASLLTFAVGAVLVALGVTVPFVGVPLTMAMVGAAAVPIGHIVSAFVPDTYNQQINALATKVGQDVATIKAIVPQVSDTYPSDKITNVTTGNFGG